MKVLIITYYWPPSGGSGVQRWLKFVKYLPGFGVTPYVFVPENPSFDLRDESLLKDVPPEAEVIHFPIWEPYKLAGASGTQSSSSISQAGWSKSIMTWIRGNLIFPDPRIFWVKPSVQFLQGFLKDNKIDTVITTGPPHSVHLIGLRLKKKNPTLKWIADFRDPWSEWGMLLSFNLTFWARRIHQKMEREVLRLADRVITITPFYLKQLERLSARKVDLITNGYDDADFSELKISRTKKFLIRHVGLVNPSCDPRPFMNALKQVALSNDDFRARVEINFTGQVNNEFKLFVQEDDVLQKLTVFSPSAPHKELISLYGQSSALLLVLTGYKDGEGFLPGKLFEYLATGLPVIAVGPLPSDADSVLREADRPGMIASENEPFLKAELLRVFENWKQGLDSEKLTDPSRYSRKQLTFKLTELLKTL